MSILAMYEARDWRCPARVLTHLEDIGAALSDSGLVLLQLPGPQAETQSEWQAQAQQRIAAQGLPVPQQLAAHQPRGQPGYAATSTQLQADQIRVSVGQWLLLCAGQARFCVSDGAHALLLAAAPGDLLWIPAGREWALEPAAGVQCCWLALAAAEPALNDAPPAQSKLSELQLLDI
ncbi:MAG: hypothetical protein V7756_12265 [Halopseudomonas sp.]|uniref:hypothetical protein n=1 Tax=Halopseudomonas sp. TaxID=2901191 RepID=UPI0030011D01